MKARVKLRVRNVAVVAVFAALGLITAGCGEDSQVGAGVAVVDQSTTSTGDVEPSPTGESEVTTNPESNPSTSDGSTGDGGESSTTAGSASPDWASVDFENFEYRLEAIGDPFTVTDGEFRRGEPGSTDFAYVKVFDVGIGDIGDGPEQEAYVSIFFNAGGTGQFSDVLVYGWANGGPELLDRAGTGDRGLGGVADATIDGDTLRITQDEGDAACCPDRRVTVGHQIQDGRLNQVSGPVEQALIFVDDVSLPPEIKFLRGTTSAVVAGESSGGEVAFFEAGNGQRLTLVVDALHGLDPLDSFEVVEAIEVVDSASGQVLLTVEADQTGTVVLPTAGFYSLRALAGGELRVFEFEMDIR